MPAEVDLVVQAMTVAHAEAVLAIYAEGIATGNATLETVVPDWRRWNATHRRDCRFVARRGAEVVGWVALGAYSARDVYAGVAWDSVYVAASARGLGVGRHLLETLIPTSEELGVWTLTAGVLTENLASLALHNRVGFRRIGVHERIGRDATGRWRDVVILERRSERVGT